MIGFDYTDVLKKFNFYKEEVLKEFIIKGVYPDNSLIANRLNSIDMHLALFNHNNVVEGHLFNTEEYNAAIKLIYNDIKILFELLEELQIKEYNKQQAFIESYTNELYSVVNTYKKRAEYENASTTFGKTLLFADNSFKIKVNNSTTTIELGDLEINDASSILCLANVNNVNPENLLFTFKNKATSEECYITPYNYSSETLLMPGEKIINETSIKMQDDQKLTGPIILQVPGEINHSNKYTVMAGKNQVLINYKDNSGYNIEDVPTSLGAVVFNNKCYINFYILNGNSVSFRFNKKPISANFPIEEQRITNLKKIHHFFMECDENFAFEVELDKGEIFAAKEAGIINNSRLYYSGTNLVKDFKVIEESPGKINSYSAKLNIFNDNDESYEIDSIIIKQAD